MYLYSAPYKYSLFVCLTSNCSWRLGVAFIPISEVIKQEFSWSQAMEVINKSLDLTLVLFFLFLISKSVCLASHRIPWRELSPEYYFFEAILTEKHQGQSYVNYRFDQEELLQRMNLQQYISRLNRREIFFPIRTVPHFI